MHAQELPFSHRALLLQMIPRWIRDTEDMCILNVGGLVSHPVFTPPGSARE